MNCTRNNRTICGSQHIWLEFSHHFRASMLTPNQPGALDTRFKKYIARFRNLVVAADIANPARQKALLLHYAGEEVHDIFETLPDTESGKGDNAPRQGNHRTNQLLHTKEKPSVRGIQISRSRSRARRDADDILHSSQTTVTHV